MILAPDAPHDTFETDDHNNPTCPIWDGLRIVKHRFTTVEKNIHSDGSRYYSSRAGGPFLLVKDGAALLDSESPDGEQKNLTNRQKVNLSHWIYKHNLDNRLLDELSNEVLQDPRWFARWLSGHRDREPSAEDRMLHFLRESIRDWDADPKERQPSSDLKMAAGGCRNSNDRKELENHAAAQGWMGVSTDRGVNTFTRRVNLPARIHVEERTRKLDLGRQGFVAMWFDPSMDDAYDHGIKPAICDAGYKALKINDKPFTGGVVDEIMAEIRKSRFVVADFTSSPESGARGGVYFEAGFALGLGKTVFLTCRKDRTEAVHFDIGHLNRIEWETPEDLRKQLKNSILAVLDRGPLDPPDGQPTDRRQPERTAA